jgi:hypothetical protein
MRKAVEGISIPLLNATGLNCRAVILLICAAVIGKAIVDLQV